MNPIEYDKLRWQESETIRNLLKKQNTFLGGSLENLDHLIYLQKSINLLNLIKWGAFNKLKFKVLFKFTQIKLKKYSNKNSFGHCKYEERKIKQRDFYTLHQFVTENI